MSYLISLPGELWYLMQQKDALVSGHLAGPYVSSIDVNVLMTSGVCSRTKLWKYMNLLWRRILAMLLSQARQDKHLSRLISITRLLYRPNFYQQHSGVVLMPSSTLCGPDITFSLVHPSVPSVHPLTPVSVLNGRISN